MAVDISSLYVLDVAQRRGSFSAEYGSEEPAGMQLDRLEHLFWGIETPKMPVLFHWAEGSRLYDILLSTLPSYLVSTRVLHVLEAVAATGWSHYPIELRGKANELIEGYSGLVVTGRCGPLQYDKSREETRIGASGKPYIVKIGLHFDESTWDGSEVFTPQGATFVFVTDKVRRAVESARISNVTITRLSDFERFW